jgi:mono/diheme cytochrome c family protein
MRAGLAAGFAGVFAVGSLGTATAQYTAADRYVLNCSGCHRLDGAGIPGFAPSLHDLAGLAGTEAGRAYLARVPGVAQAPIGDADLAALLDWVVARFSGLPIESRFDAGRVAGWRAEPLRDPATARARLVATDVASSPVATAPAPAD